MDSRKRGAKKKSGSHKPAPKKSKMSSRKPLRVLSRQHEESKKSRANLSMNITELQFMAKSRGIPFGGLTKTKLVRKINNY